MTNLPNAILRMITLEPEVKITNSLMHVKAQGGYPSRCVARFPVTSVAFRKLLDSFIFGVYFSFSASEAIPQIFLMLHYPQNQTGSVCYQSKKISADSKEQYTTP